MHASETTTIIRSRDDPFSSARSSHPTPGVESCSLPKPSYPALCRQDTTYPWSTDLGGNIQRETRILMLAMKQKMKKCEKWKNEKKKRRGHPQQGHSYHLSTKAQKSKSSQKENRHFFNRNFSTFFSRFQQPKNEKLKGEFQGLLSQTQNIDEHIDDSYNFL